MQCTYEKQDGSTCTRQAVSDRGLCILHEDWEHKDEEETEEFFNEEIEEERGRGDYEGCILPEIYIGGKIPHVLNFTKATIEGQANLEGAEIEGHIIFDEADVGDIVLERATIKGYASFKKTIIGGEALFDDVTIHSYLSFEEATIVSNAMFNGAKIEGGVSFSGATFKEGIIFGGSDISASYFLAATICDLKTLEEIFRTAKIEAEGEGDRHQADEYFYGEMATKRKRKKRFARWLESPIQYVFGYGVRPFRVIRSWLLVVIAFALIYWLGHGVEEATSFWHNLYFSVVTAATPGYGGYYPESGTYQVLASFQAIFGTFMWAAIIATFARKFMR